MWVLRSAQAVQKGLGRVSAQSIRATLSAPATVSSLGRSHTWSVVSQAAQQAAPAPRHCFSQVVQQAMQQQSSITAAATSLAARQISLQQRKLIRCVSGKTRSFCSPATSKTAAQGMGEKAKAASASSGSILHSARAAVGGASSSVRQARSWLQNLRLSNKLQRAISLQFEAFWQNHKRKVFAVAGLFVAYLLWKTLFGVTSIFVNLSETMAETGFLALALAIVAFGILYLRHLYTIDPGAVYRSAMVRLNTDPAVLEVMGAPLAGSDVRATMLTGGGVKLQGLWPKYRSRRLHMIFPLKGADRRGLVSLEAKKVKGRYRFKLLAVDVPSAVGPEQRVFLEGSQAGYERGGVMAELRDPFLRALQLRESYEVEDEADEAAEEAQERQEAAAEKVRRAQKGPKPLDQGGGMYLHERLLWPLRFWWSRVSQPAGRHAEGAAPGTSSAHAEPPGARQPQPPVGAAAAGGPGLEAATHGHQPGKESGASPAHGSSGLGPSGGFASRQTVGGLAGASAQPAQQVSGSGRETV